MQVWRGSLISATLLIGVSALPADAEPTRIALLLPPAEAYKSPIRQIEQALVKRGHVCEVFELPAIQQAAEAGDREPPAPAATSSAPAADDERSLPEVAAALERVRAFRPALIVTAGNNATALALHAIPDIPVVFCEVPNALDRGFMAADAPQRSRVTGITTDISPSDQIGWLNRLAPKVRRLGILCSDNSRRTAEAMAVPARAKGISIELVSAGKDSFAAAVAELNAKGCDGVLMIADANVYNSPNAQALLLWGLRGRKPVWAFSANLVKAGAFGAIYADGREMPAQMAELIDKIVRGEKPVALGLQYPRATQRAINEQTADLIGISIPADAVKETVRFGRK